MKQIIFMVVLLIFFSGFFVFYQIEMNDNSSALRTDSNYNNTIIQNKISDTLKKDIFSVVQKKYILSNGMVESEKNKTTSESQSYGMLMMVISDDQESFDKIWNWTKNNLQTRHKDKLFSWLWEKGSVKDVNPATDADQDIAYALYLAHKKWGDERYLSESKDVVRDIWNIETKEIGGVRYMSAGNWATQDKRGVVVNPSYLSPYEYRIFSTIDPEHNWMSIVESSYKALELCSGQLGLVMDWCLINNQGKVVKDFKLRKKDSSIYSYDALRVPYRVAMDYALYDEMRAFEYLKKNSIFVRDWEKHGKIFVEYRQDGHNINKNESLANYGAQLASMSLMNREIAKEIFEKKIVTVDSWEGKSFYDMIWVWFGLNFYADRFDS